MAQHRPASPHPQPETVVGALADKAAPAAPAGTTVAKRDARDWAQQALDKISEAVAAQLPAQIPAEYFMRAILTGLRKDRKLLQIVANPKTRPTFYAALLEAARFGLMPFTDEAALVPFGGKNPTVTFIPQYKGLIKTWLNSGQVAAVEARLIHRHDDWELSYGDDGRFYHRPRLFDDNGEPADRGEPILAYCFVRLKDGSRTSVVILTRQEAIEIRDRFSKSYDSAEKSWGGRPPARDSAWHTDFDSQWIKSTVRRVRDVPQNATLVQLLLAAARDDTYQPPAAEPDDFATWGVDIGDDEDVLVGEVLSDEPDDADEPDDSVHDQRRRRMARMHATFGDLDLGGDENRLQRIGICNILGRETPDMPVLTVTSSAELSDDQIERIIAGLDRFRDAAKDEPQATTAMNLAKLARAGGWGTGAS